MEIGARIKEHRAAAGMSQDDLAARVYVSRQTIRNWEQGQGAPALDKAAELARLYGVTLDDLASDEVDIVSSRRTDHRDLHVLERFVGRRVTIGFTCDVDRGYIEHAELLDVSESWLRVSHLQKTARFGSPKVEERATVTLITAADVASIIEERA